MKFENRFIRLAAALTIVGIVVTQIPSRNSVAFAQVQDGYPDKNNGFFSLKGTGGIILGAIIVGAGSGAILRAGGVAAGSSSGVIGSKSIYDIVDSKSDDFSIITKLIRNSEQVENYRKNGPFTIFAPTNDALIKALGADIVTNLQTTAKQTEAKQLLQSITVKGAYSISALKDAAKSGKVLEALSGQPVSLKLSGDKLTANGIEILNNESPAINGWVIATNGVINKDN